MKVVFPDEIVKDIANGGYKKEEEEREHPDPGPDPEPDPQPSGSTDYNDLENKPRINGTELVGDKDFSDLGTRSLTEEEVTGLFV